MNKLILNKLILFKSNYGATEIGIVITSFFLLILVIIPLNLTIQEISLLNNVNQSVQVASEMTMLDMMEGIDFDWLSEGQIRYSQESINEVEELLRDKLEQATGFKIEPENVSFELIANTSPKKIEVKFNYMYTSKIFLKDKLKKNMFVKLYFELPINR